ncbi:hypothetical protein [Bartonella sp. DGB1]|uniref:hypothetical protein n=1 Tax=Bartonella sp. DGB1 TaxID=3239807 RepID=UPI0035252CAF
MTNTATKNESIILTVREVNGVFTIDIAYCNHWSEELFFEDKLTGSYDFPTILWDNGKSKLDFQVRKENNKTFLDASYKNSKIENIPIYKGLKLELS